MKYQTGLLANVCLTNTSGSSCDRTGATITPSNSYYSTVAGVHNGGANYLMADCHAKWFMPSRVAVGVDNTENTWNAPATCPGNFTQAPTTGCANPVQYAATFA